MHVCYRVTASCGTYEKGEQETKHSHHHFILMNSKYEGAARACEGGKGAGLPGGVRSYWRVQITCVNCSKFI